MTLKWRIALGYTVLLGVVLAAVSWTVLWRLQAILYDQAADSANAAIRSIVAAVVPGPLSLEGEAGGIQVLERPGNLVNWVGPTGYVQVDDEYGNPLSKTSNLTGFIPANAAVTETSPTAYRELKVEGRPFLVEDRFLRQGANAVIIHVATPLEALYRTLSQARQVVAIIGGGAFAAVVMLSIALAAQATTPINQLSRAMREIGLNRLDRRLQWQKRNDEIGQLAESFDDLLARLEEAFARERQFISDASHELKTPLTSINANAQMLLRWGDRDEAVRRESLETISHESGALAEMVKGMLTLAKADRGDDIPKEPVSLAQIASEAVKAAAPRAQVKGLKLEFEPSATPTIFAEGGLIRQLVANLVDNAIKFTEAGGVDVRVGSDDGRAWVEVSDTGPGIPEAELPHVFERFYRADKARSRSVPGTGLGLAIVRSIARVHGGEVTAGRASSGGARFLVTLPRFTDLS